MNTQLNIFPEFNSEQTIYYINALGKISKGNIIGFQAESVVLDQNKNVLKVGQGSFQIKKNDSIHIEIISATKVFNKLEDALKKICDSENIFLEIKKEFQPNIIFQNPELHNENTFNPIDSFDEYQKIAMSTKAYGTGLPIFYPALKLNGEAGEVAEKVGKAWRDKEGKFDDDYILEIKKEMGDVLWYICALADDLKINLADVANSNIAKILDRRKRGVVSGEGDNR